MMGWPQGEQSLHVSHSDCESQKFIELCTRTYHKLLTHFDFIISSLAKILFYANENKAANHFASKYLCFSIVLDLHGKMFHLSQRTSTAEADQHRYSVLPVSWSVDSLKRGHCICHCEKTACIIFYFYCKQTSTETTSFSISRLLYLTVTS